tara:strand:- start:3362 stop:4519 length:1158 start_codon:yes stop_codon:yes gene_type:complete
MNIGADDKHGPKTTSEEVITPGTFQPDGKATSPKDSAVNTPKHPKKKTGTEKFLPPIPDASSWPGGIVPSAIKELPPPPIEQAVELLKNRRTGKKESESIPVPFPDMQSTESIENPMQNSPFPSAGGAEPEDKISETEIRKPLNKKPVKYDEIDDQDLILSPSDVVIGPKYVLTTLAKSMDANSKKVEPQRQKKIELDNKIRSSLPDFKHGFRSKRFVRKVGRPAVAVKIPNKIRKVPVTKSPVKHLKIDLKSKKNATFSTFQNLSISRIKSVKNRISLRLPNIGKSKESQAPHFYNTSKEISTLPPQTGSAITIQYSSILLNSNKLYIKKLKVNSPSTDQSVMQSVVDHIKSVLWYMNDTPGRWAYFFTSLALILILIVGIVLN